MNNSLSASFPESFSQTGKSLEGFISSGDTVITKPGTIDSYSKLEVSGWQGRVLEVMEDEEEWIALIQWDSITLKQMPKDFIIESIKEGLNWAEFTIPLSELNLAQPRASDLDTDWTRAEIGLRLIWTKMGPQGRRIIKVLNKKIYNEEVEVLEIWRRHLENSLEFPINCVIDYPEEDGPLHENDICQAVDLAAFDEKLGIYSWINIGDKQFGIPLYDIRVSDSTSNNYRAINDYRVWWANH
jgi:hypothetical protein